MTAQLLAKNQEHTVEIIDLNHEGSGVAKIEGYSVFIPGVLQGEIARIKLIKVGKKFGFGRLIYLEKTSNHRTEPPCVVYDKCGGCQLQHLAYDAQLVYKQNQVAQVMKRIAKLDVPVLQTVGMEEPFRYRNKAQVPVGYVHHKLVAGFYQKRSHQIIDMDTCLIQSKANDDGVQIARSIFEKYGVVPYDEEQHQGDLRHIMTRVSFATGELMLVIITRKASFPFKEQIIKELEQTIPNLVSIVQNVNPHKTNVIFGEKTQVLAGDEYLVDTIHGIRFVISARSFYQVNPVQTEKLYQLVLDKAELTGEEIVFDAYCGIGSISLCLAKQAKHVYGVEVISEAIADALLNAHENHFTNVTFETGKAENVIPNWYKKRIKADVLVVDPPRKGCDEKLLETILTMKPKRVVYVSCDPATLARDMRILVNGGYQAGEVQPVDMFPMTTHVECVTVLEINNEN
ncbi:23S rRNA (uracil(1939)-C(5))-methyltransferase RlmD [Listeria sp. PSOL-1]|uniref:23S rRNA (uracil(1939)-C(5))-methyltransferase RlmD n=1 Tax=Listeria sp. PSOL-1 TaxID=1844999 RepID=UPI0013D4C084|nr:23S rRNA (uracil(1939)-C(5))-methyltransferase RlmD [Listeria sp. PSOL-1]